MGYNEQKGNKLRKLRSVDKYGSEKPVSYLNIFILLAYGYITVLTPNLKRFDSNGSKFLALAILNLVVWCYFIYREHRNNSFSTFSNFFNTKIGLAHYRLVNK
ncbi:MAG: hypothetical protein H8E34_13865 [Bacteroidetes bacterium]|nr:hypothetical protein [Bacteroidota bacterium]